MNNFNTIHIFGYGEAQIIGKDLNKKGLITTLTKVQAVVDDIYSKKPADNTAGKEYHSVSIFEGMFADFSPKAKGEKSFRVKYAELDATKVNKLAEELTAIVVVEREKPVL